MSDVSLSGEPGRKVRVTEPREMGFRNQPTDRQRRQSPRAREGWLQSQALPSVPGSGTRVEATAQLTSLPFQAS